MKLIDRGDGVKGHYCIGRETFKTYYGEPTPAWEFWNEHMSNWCSAGTVYSKTKANQIMKEIQNAT